MPRSVLDGGCWYCETETAEPTAFTWEFDANVHISCLQARLLAQPSDDEAWLMALELLA